MDIKTQKMLADVVLNAQNKAVKPYTTTATVKSVNNGIVYVEIPGSDRDTPVKNSSVSVKKGDVVDLVVSHDDTHITGNRSDVAVPESTAQKMSQTLEATRLEMDNELDLFNNKIEMVNNEIDMQDNKIKMLGNDIEILDSTVQTQGSTIETLDSTVQTLGSNIQTLDSTVQTQGSTIQTLDSTVQTQESTIQTLDSTVQTLGSNIQTLDSDVKIINSAFVIQDGKLTGISKIITDILDSGYVTTDLLNADVAWIQNGKIKEEAIGTAEIADASITTAKIDELSADVITSGTIRTERLILTTDEVNPETGEKKVALITALNAKVNAGEGNILDGAVIADDTIEAAKIDVVDLNAFKATIGNFTIGTSSMHNGKTSLKDPTNGVYIGTDGIALGQGSLLGLTDDSPFRVESDGDFHLGAKDGNYINFNAFTGALDINAKTIKMESKSVASTEDVTTAIEGIAVGGRNLLLGSANPVNKFSWNSSSGSATITEETMLGTKGILLDITIASSDQSFCCYAFGPSRMELIKPIRYYTLSFDIYPNVDDFINFKIMDPNRSNAISSYSDDKKIVAGEWNHVSLTVETFATITISEQVIYIGGINSVATYKICNFKLEEGNKATDWTPAPEDTEESITEVKTIAEQTADKFSWLVKSGTSATNFELTDRTATLVANHINLNGLVTFSGLNSDAQNKINNAENAVNNLEIGGRNLIKNSNFAQGTAYWTAEGGTLSVVSDSTYSNHLEFVLTSGTTRIYNTISNVWKKNQTYSYSFYAKASESATLTPSRSISDFGKTHTITTEWKRYTGTIYSTVTSSGGTLSFTAGSLNVTYYIANVKLEIGNKATDWSPAPEDISVENIYTPNKTTIDGGKITSGSIKAEKINVKDLFSQNITATNMTISGDSKFGNFLASTEIEGIAYENSNYGGVMYLGKIVKLIDEDEYGFQLGNRSSMTNIQPGGVFVQSDRGGSYPRKTTIHGGFIETFCISTSESGGTVSIGSDIVPLYSDEGTLLDITLGSSYKKFADLYTSKFNGTSVNSHGIASENEYGVTKLSSSYTSSSTSIAANSNAVYSLYNIIKTIITRGVATGVLSFCTYANNRLRCVKINSVTYSMTMFSGVIEVTTGSYDISYQWTPFFQIPEEFRPSTTIQTVVHVFNKNTSRLNATYAVEIYTDGVVYINGSFAASAEFRFVFPCIMYI